MLRLTSAADLAREEARISKKKTVELFEKGLMNDLPAGKFATPQSIHQHLFEGIYEFAGQVRTVNIAKGYFRFAPVMYLDAALANIDNMPQSTFDEIIEKYVEMNVAHPFREGNGRRTCIWLDHILKTPGAVPPPIPDAAYHIAVNGQATGPFALSVLAQMATAGRLTSDSLVWKTGMAQWAKTGTVDELKNLFANEMPPIPPQQEFSK